MLDRNAPSAPDEADLNPALAGPGDAPWVTPVVAPSPAAPGGPLTDMVPIPVSLDVARRLSPVEPLSVPIAPGGPSSAALAVPRTSTAATLERIAAPPGGPLLAPHPSLESKDSHELKSIEKLEAAIFTALYSQKIYAMDCDFRPEAEGQALCVEIIKPNVNNKYNELAEFLSSKEIYLIDRQITNNRVVFLIFFNKDSLDHIIQACNEFKTLQSGDAKRLPLPIVTATPIPFAPLVTSIPDGSEEKVSSGKSESDNISLAKDLLQKRFTKEADIFWQIEGAVLGLVVPPDQHAALTKWIGDYHTDALQREISKSPNGFPILFLNCCGEGSFQWLISSLTPTTTSTLRF